MPDISAPYSLTTDGGNIYFNDNSEDQYFLEEVRGLESTPIRAPIDPKPLLDGGLVHNFFRGPRHIAFEGFFYITSSSKQNTILEIRNDMEDALRSALDSMLQADGTLAWTPYGQAARQLLVRYEIPLECPHAENYLQRRFSFGLVAAEPQWS